MFGFSGLKLFGGLFGLIACGALLWAAQDRFRLADIVDQAKQCAKDGQEPPNPGIPAVLIVNVQSGRHQTPTSAIDTLESVSGA